MDKNPTFPTCTFPTCRLPELVKMVAKLNRRASKLFLPPVGYEVVREFALIIRDKAGKDTKGRLPMVEIRLTGTAPVVNGQTLIARIEHTDAGNILAHAPGVEGDLPEQYKTAKPFCEHCHSLRRRNDTYVLRSEAGEYKQIGRNCLADYLRSTDVGSALGVWKLMAAMREMGEESESWGGGGHHIQYEALTFLAYTFSVIRQEGWVSKSAARDHDKCPTAASVAILMSPAMPNEKARVRLWREQMVPNASDLEKAEAAIAWARALPDTSDYYHNLRIALAGEYVDPRHGGLVASVAVAYAKHLEQEINRAKLRAAINPTHFGEVNKRYDLQLEVRLVRYLESAYGVTTLYIFSDLENRRYKWFASGSKGIDAGDKVTLRGTIKAHGDYQGIAETILTRCTCAKIDTLNCGTEATPTSSHSENSEASR